MTRKPLHSSNQDPNDTVAESDDPARHRIDPRSCSQRNPSGPPHQDSRGSSVVNGINSPIIAALGVLP